MDEVKGDVARMLFYMVVRYEGDDGEPDLELVDEIVDKKKIMIHVVENTRYLLI